MKLLSPAERNLKVGVNLPLIPPLPPIVLDSINDDVQEYVPSDPAPLSIKPNKNKEKLLVMGRCTFFLKLFFGIGLLIQR